MYKAIILAEANIDIREAAKWYNKQSVGLGKIFIKEIKEHVLFIRQNPSSYNIRYDTVRTAVLKKFPFMIHYSIDETNQTVIFSAVFHTSRNPKFWKNR